MPTLAAEQLVRAVGDDLVGVHVGRGAGAGLEDVDHELVVELAVGDLVRRARRSPRRASASSSPSSRLTCAAAPLISPMARMKRRGKRRSLIGKFCTARIVCTP